MNGLRILCLLPVLVVASVAACSGSDSQTAVTSAAGTGGFGGNGSTGSVGGAGGSGGAPCTDPGSQCPAPQTTCVVAVCEAGACATQDAPTDTACSDGGGQVCDGSGVCVACTDVAAHCPPPANECVLATCAAGACGTASVADGTVTSAGQIPGDCKRQVCDGAGSTKVIDDDADPQDDLNDCTADTCSGGAGVHPPIAGGCDDGGGAVCADPAGPKAGQCVECNVDADCAAPEVCDPASGSNKCVPPQCTDTAKNGDETDVDCGGSCPSCADSQVCLIAADCQSGFCSAGACAPCGADADCPASSFCDLAAANGGTCTADEGDGQSCTLASQCTSGSCVDGVCCDTACTGVCEACSAALKGQGLDGTCGAVVAGDDPESECAQSPASTCQGTGVCNGAGACELHAAGVVCAPQSCSGGAQQNIDLCNGAGSCVDGGTTGCGAFVCNAGGTACLSSCGGDTDCAAGNYCNGGACAPKLINGVVCSAANQCAGGNCIDGVCCNAACGALCQACNVAGSVGTCTSVPNATDPANECAGATSCNGAGACNSANGAACASPAQCASGNCVDGVCCSAACGALCQACNVAGSVGTCTSVPNATDPANECAGLSACNGAGACTGFLKWSEGTNQWPDQACNPTNSFGNCDTNAANHANAWAAAVCQQNGFTTGLWTGNKAPGCTGAISMYCQGQIPCVKAFEFACAPSDQTKIEVICY